MKNFSLSRWNDHPLNLDFLLLVLTFIHYLLGYYEKIPNVWSGFLVPESVERVDALFVGAMAPAAIVSGFAGVVVVFALSADGNRFRTLRIKGGKPLEANWLSVSQSGFSAVFLYLSACVLNILDQRFIAAYFFEAGCLLLIHGSVRLVWLLSRLTKVIRAQDLDHEKRDTMRTASGMFK